MSLAKQYRRAGRFFAWTFYVVVISSLYMFWLFYGPDKWEVIITGVSGDGNNTPYRIETIVPDTGRIIVFENIDAFFGHHILNVIQLMYKHVLM